VLYVFWLQLSLGNVFFKQLKHPVTRCIRMRCTAACQYESDASARIENASVLIFIRNVVEAWLTAGRC